MEILCEQDNAYEFNEREFERLGIEYKNKSILAIGAEIYYPFSGDISVSIAYHLKNGETVTLEKLSAGTPMPNKNVIAAQTKIGRKKTRDVIPIVFESLDELYRVDCVEIVWNINNQQFVVLEYHVTFKKPVQKSVYGLRSYDFPYSRIGHMDEFGYEDGYVVSRPHDSVYEDVVLLSIRGGICTPGLHVQGDRSDLDIETIYDTHKKILSPKMTALISRVVPENMRDKVAKNSKIVYYRSNEELNDRGVITLF